MSHAEPTPTTASTETVKPETKNTEPAETPAPGDEIVAHVESHIANIDASAWDRCANPDPDSYNPFLSHTFLNALETSGCVGPRTGWYPQHLAIVDTTDSETNTVSTSTTDDTKSATTANNKGTVRAVMPCYLKTHSQGEYVFDYGWADAFERAGGRYYPKLQTAVPFTPVTGRRFLVADPNAPEAAHLEHALLSAVVELASRHNASSFHATFCTKTEWDRIAPFGLLQRTDRQFHWHNDGFETFDDFLSALASRKRKAVRKERREALASGLEVEWLTGADITEGHWDAFYDFYEDTGARKWGTPYLNRRFFSELSAKMGEQVLLILARRDGEYIAGALNMIGGDTLYGRYWGCTEHLPYLHFEICYYQAIDYAIQHGLKHVEAGAQGEHKLARGYVPQETYSLHWIPHSGLRDAVERHLVREREYVSMEAAALREYAPFRKS